jgi:hypothetical protein
MKEERPMEGTSKDKNSCGKTSLCNLVGTREIQG